MLLQTLLLAALAPQGSTSLAPREVAIAAAVDKLFGWQKTVGGAVGIVKDGNLVYIKTYGLRNIAKNEPVDENTRFEIGSVTKQFTAAAILQLQEAGKLSIDDKLARYFPNFPHADDITLRQLLNQVTGLEDYLHHLPPDKFSSNGGLDAVAALVNVPLRFTPGTRWEYSNTNYYVLGKVIEKVSGESFEAYVRGHLFRPAGMTHSAFIQDESSLTDHAVGYWKGPDDKLPPQPAPLIRDGWAGGAGEIVSTIADMAAWDNALASGKIVTAQDYALMSTPPVLPNGARDTYGMGLGVDPLEGHRRIWHNGGSAGSITMNATYPDDHLDIIVFENSAWCCLDPGDVEVAAFESIFPEAAIAARTAAPGEDLAVRPRILHFIDEALTGSLQSSELMPRYAKIAAHIQKQIAQSFAQAGKPTSITFKGEHNTTQDTIYHYRVDFAMTAVNCDVIINKKTNLVDGIALGPA